MSKITFWLLTPALALMLMAVWGCGANTASTDEGNQLITAAYKQKDYQRLLTLADSLEHSGDLITSTANYWKGYASDRLKQKDAAVGYWQAAIDAAAKSDSEENLDIYVKAASRLANLLCLSGDYEGTLSMAQPVTERLEQLKCDSTSDYINLLIYIGLSQVSTGVSEEDAQVGFLRACRKHRENIDNRKTDDAYKDAIAGLVNIAYYCVQAGKYESALYYTSNFGDLLIEYEQRTGVDQNYVDRQVGRYTIYKAWALDHTGRKQEAAETYKAFLATHFSTTPEGQKLAANYQEGLNSGELKEEQQIE